MKYQTMLRRTRVILEESSIQVETDTAQQALEQAFAMEVGGWVEVDSMQVLVSLASAKKLKFSTYLQATADEIKKGEWV